MWYPPTAICCLTHCVPFLLSHTHSLINPPFILAIYWPLTNTQSLALINTDLLINPVSAHDFLVIHTNT